MADGGHAISSYYWHDYETSGTDPQRDRPVQFAGARTDQHFNSLDHPQVYYCKPALDTLPHPDACLLTGITPQFADQNGVSEAEFIRLIHEQLCRANTCTLGYNTLRFDDEVTRNCLYRNFYDPYAREWQNGNSRWDLIDLVRAACALRPEGVVWPVDDEGKPDFKLVALAKANGISHEAAHDALSDVYATLALARLLNNAQPKLFSFLRTHRHKAAACDLLSLGSGKALVHVSGMYPAVKHCLAIVLPVCQHPNNSNGIIVYDLSIDPEPLMSLSADEIRQRIFTAAADLPEGVARIPLKTVHVNKCPVLAPLSVIRPNDERRLLLDLTLSEQHRLKINAATGLPDKIGAVFSEQNYQSNIADPDLQIYSGGFFSDADRQKMTQIRMTAPELLVEQKITFNDGRLPEMLFRYRARNYPETLNNDELSSWKAFCADRLTGRKSGAGITFHDYFQRLSELKNATDADNTMIEALERYGREKIEQLGLSLDSLSASLLQN